MENIAQKQMKQGSLIIYDAWGACKTFNWWSMVIKHVEHIQKDRRSMEHSNFSEGLCGTVKD